jgi:VCBS repeat-containing protein
VTDITVDEEATANEQATATDVETLSENLVYSLGSPASHGTATVNADGTYSYTSYNNYNGSDSFEITVTDEGGLTDTETVNVTVGYIERSAR